MSTFLLSFTCVLLAAEPPPAALRKAFEHNQGSVVTVRAGGRSGPGVVVGAHGQILTSVEYVSLYAAEVIFGGRAHPAEVLLADASQGIAVVQLRTAEGLRAAPVAADAKLQPGQALVAVRVDRSGTRPLLTQVRRLSRDGESFQLSDRLPKGTPLFDARRQLVGIVTGGRKALRLEPVKQKLSASGG